MNSVHTANKLYELHKKAHPDSQLSLRAIRTAIKSGELPSIKAGNRRLVDWDVFTGWLEGRRQ